MTFIRKLIAKTKKYFLKEYFGFVLGHQYIKDKQIKKIKTLVGKTNQKIILNFETLFANIVGDGDCISYASARMGFYEIMNFLDIKKGDEIIILGATCSVMINAIKRKGAIPKYSDIDIKTLGSDYLSIENLISKKTKIIITQHSFGIPCDIEPIVNIAKQKNIFLLEDCALTLGSSYKNLKVGNFGDAAIFSTDHSKPINTLTGGLVYSNKKKIIKSLRSKHVLLNDLSQKKQKALWNQFLFERKIRNPKNEGKIFLLNSINNQLVKYFHKIEPFLTEDFSISSKNSYPYPSKMPTFLAAIGIMELKNWPIKKKQRIKNLNKLKSLFRELSIEIPESYHNNKLEIIPLRFVWENKNNNLLLKKIDEKIDTTGFWFTKPIIATDQPLEKFDYQKGMSPLSESLGERIVNIPCNLNDKDFSKLLKSLEIILKKSYY